MSKRRPAFSADQLAFTFEVPAVQRHEGALAGLARTAPERECERPQL